MEMKVKLSIDAAEVEEAKEKVKELVSLLQEAKELADSIASKRLDIYISAKSDDDSAEWAHITG